MNPARLPVRGAAPPVHRPSTGHAPDPARRPPTARPAGASMADASAFALALAGAVGPEDPTHSPDPGLCTGDVGFSLMDPLRSWLATTGYALGPSRVSETIGVVPMQAATALIDLTLFTDLTIKSADPDCPALTPDLSPTALSLSTGRAVEGFMSSIAVTDLSEVASGKSPSLSVGHHTEVMGVGAKWSADGGKLTFQFPSAQVTEVLGPWAISGEVGGSLDVTFKLHGDKSTERDPLADPLPVSVLAVSLATLATVLKAMKERLVLPTPILMLMLDPASAIKDEVNQHRTPGEGPA